MSAIRLHFAATAVLCILFAVSAAMAQVPESMPGLQRPQLTVEHSQSQIELRGDVSSLTHEAILHQTVLNRFSQKEPLFHLTVRAALPPGWALITELTLGGLAETHSGIAEIDQTGIFVRGVTTNAARWASAAMRIEKNLLPGMTFRQEVEEIRPSGSFNRQCIELFRTAIRGRKIEFERASAELRTSSAPLLDELIQIVIDCPQSNLTVTGHTDNTGSEAGNLALSAARAEAVASYMAAAGVSGERIITIGTGSSQPLVDENNSRAHQMNRRIDLQIVFP